MDVAVVGGTGEEGYGLSLRLARAGTHVVIGSRSAERGAEAARRISETLSQAPGEPRVDGTSNEDAVAACDVVLVTVPFAGQADIYRSIREAVRPGAIVCDCTSPLATAVGGRAWQVLRPWHGSAAEQAKALLPANVRLVSGFQTVSGGALADLEHDLDEDVLLCGADPEAKATVGALVERIPRLRWVDAGPLAMARIVETLTAALVGVNRAYGIRTAGIRLTGREAWGAPADRGGPPDA